MARKLNKIERDALDKFNLKCKEIFSATVVKNVNETKEQKKKRIKKALTTYTYFVNHYFPHYAKSRSAKFQIKAANAILADRNIFAILEWAREHAKSVHACVLIPLWLLIHGELEGMLLVGANKEAAIKLLSDLQAELQNNQRFINDFGEQFSFGNWQEGDFTTKDGINFKALGRGQSPRGIRNQESRPNYCVIDDIDDETLNRNERRTLDVVDWILSALIGALSIKGGRVVVANNRIHRKSVLAHLVGDLEPDMPKREGIWHSKVCAIENGKPAWPENFTIAELEKRMHIMGYRRAQKEYFHNAIVEGKVFKNEWFEFKPRMKNPDVQVIYIDPSFKSSKDNDFKAVRHWGKKGRDFQLLKAWVRQASISSMVIWCYDYFEELYPSLRGENGRSSEEVVEVWMEANFIQDLLLDEFVAEGLERGWQLPVRADRRKKPDKDSRIEQLTPLYERGFMSTSDTERDSRDVQTGKEQYLGIEPGRNTHDDAPDADEGAIWLLQRRGRSKKNPPRHGKRKQRGW